MDKTNTKTYTEDEYLASHGASRQDIGDSAFHKNKGNNSDKTWKRLVNMQAEKDHLLIIKRAELRKEFYERIAKGEIRAKNRTEELMETAKGHPDNLATQAARRLIVKLYKRRGIEIVDLDAFLKNN